MHTPTKAQMQIVIDNLKKVLPLTSQKGALCMYQPSVNADGYPCGTIHCFAGWYAVATLDTATQLYFTDGKEQMHIDLGFPPHFSFSYWADQFPKLWGNDDGTNMYSFAFAFYHPIKRPEGALNLQHIIDHLEEVRDRLPA